MKKFSYGGTPIHEQVRDDLLDQIQDGVYMPGQALPPERKLAEEMGVSRHSVRQALSSLEGVGLIEIRHGAGIFLTASATDDAVARVAETVVARGGSIPKILEVRRAIEPYVARLAAERRTEDNLRAMAPLTTYSRSGAKDGSSGESTSFHREIGKATQNAVFDGVLRILISGPRRAESILVELPDERLVWERQHLDIFEAIQAGDGPAAESLMATHMDAVLEAARSVRQNHPH